MPSRLAVWAGRSAAAGLLLLAAGCGGSSGSTASSSSTSPSASTASADASATATSSSTAAATDVSTLSAKDIFPRLIAAQKKAGSYTFTITTGVAGQSLEGKGESDTSTTPPASHVQLTIAGQQVETISAGGVFYLKGGPFGTTKWLKIDPKASSALGATIGQFGSSDPTTALAALADAATVTQKGAATVGGAKTAEYDVSVPGSALIKTSPSAAQLKGLLPKTLDYQLFVGDDDLLRRLTTSLSVRGKQTSTKIDFADYGSTVSVAAPPASQTTTTFDPAG